MGCPFEVGGIFCSSNDGIWLACPFYQCIPVGICVLFVVGRLGMFEWCVLSEGGGTWCMSPGYRRFPMLGFGGCFVGVSGVSGCVGPFVLGRAVVDFCVN